MECRRLDLARRLLATLLLLCFALYGLEAEVADVHDTQADGAEVSRTDPPPPNSQTDDHPVHVCHCAHAHVGVIVTPPTLQPVACPTSLREWDAPRVAHGVRLPPPLRPPIS